MKKKIMLGAAFVFCLSIMAYGTNAFFTSEEQVHNVITTGDIDIDLIEMMEPEDGGDLVPFEDQTGVMPGTEVSKIVTVKNTGGQPAYIRVKVDKAIILADESSDNVDLSLVTYNLNTEHWTEKDGFYYYNEVLAVDAETEPLFTAVTFASEMGNMYQGSNAEIDVQAQATQVANNGTSALEALGWPEI